MPVTGENPIAHRSAVQREAHVWAAIVDSIDALLVLEEGEGVAVDLDRQLALLFEFGQAGGADKAVFAACHVLSPNRRIVDQIQANEDVGTRVLPFHAIVYCHFRS